MEIEKCKCYYEILNIESNATIEEIKKSYKKIILQYHPDKNAHLSEEQQKRYTNIFRKIQEAYECLIDEKRRKWYDKNRKRIVEGKEDEERNELNKYSYKNINIWGYFSNTCFNGYDDSEKGFYTVYKNLFDEIIKEENEEIENKYKNKKDKINAPGFGTSKSSGKEIDDFYEYWSNFTTVKKFDYFYEYMKNCEFENRNVRRTLKKINEKRGLKERKEYNENIRSLIHHLKKYDVRYLNRIVELAEEKRKKIEEKEKQKKIQMQQRRILFEQNKKKEFIEYEEESNIYSNPVEKDYSFDNMNFNFKRKINTEEIKEEDGVKYNYRNNTNDEEEMNEDYANIDNNEVKNDESDDSNIDKNNVLKKIIYRCEVCKKNFKSMKQYESHEKSKKHINNFLKSAKKYDLKNIFEENEEEKNEKKEEMCSDKSTEEHNSNKEKKKEKKFSSSQFKNKDTTNNNIYKKNGNNSFSFNEEEKSQSNENISNEETLKENVSELFIKKKMMKAYNKKYKGLKENDGIESCKNAEKGEENYEECDEDDERKNKVTSLKEKKIGEKKKEKKETSCDEKIDVSSSESSNLNEDLLSWYKTTKHNKKDSISVENSLKVDAYLQNKNNINDLSDDYATSRKKKKILKKKKKKEVTIKNENKINNFFEENSDRKLKVNSHNNHKIIDNTKNMQCRICEQTFDSRNKLFQHIEVKGHAACKNNDTSIKVNKNMRNNY